MKSQSHQASKTKYRAYVFKDWKKVTDFEFFKLKQ